MSDTPKPSEIEEKKIPEPPGGAELAEIDDLDDLDSLNANYAPSPRLKEYLNSPDSPSRYLMILSMLFGLLAVSCFMLLVFQYWKYRHHGQKIDTPVVETVKIEPTFHEAIGQYKVDWDDAEMTAELSAECSTQEACEALKEHSTEARDLIFPLLQESSRTAILNPTEKQYLRQKIAEKLNELKLGGRVIQIDFTDLQIEPRKN